MKEQDRVGSIVTLVILVALLAFIGFMHIWVHIDRKLQSKRPGEITRIPRTPINEKQLILYTGSQYSENKTPEAKILLSGPVWGENMGSVKLDKILRIVFGLEDCEENLVPSNTTIISIKMEGFKHGANCHDFEPIDGTIPGSYYTYQMYGRRIIQVTRYVVGEESYVAGFCIYNELTQYFTGKDRIVEDIDINIDVIKNLMKTPKYPGREALEHKVEEADDQPAASVTIQRNPLPDYCRNVRYCRDLKRGIMTDDESDAVYHQEWDPASKSMKTWKCIVCTGTVDSGEPPSYSTLSMV